MPGTVLAVVDFPDSTGRILAAAGQLARLLGASRVAVLAVRVEPDTSIMSVEAGLSGERAMASHMREHERLEALHDLFEVWVPEVQATGVAADWVDAEGPPDTLLAEIGRRASYLVLARPEAPDLQGGKLRLQAALFEAEKPVLMVPPGPVAVFGTSIAIAWRDDGRTIHAVKAALPLLVQAKAVHVLAGLHPGGTEPALPELLAEHSIAASLHELAVGSAPFGAALLERAHALGADLFVMGAYTHSSWRQLMLGKVTRHILAQADLPVLMRH